MPLEIKALPASFIPEIIEIAERSFDIVWPPRDFSYFLLHECGLCLGIFEDDVLVGYFIGLLVQGDLDVISIATAPPHRRRGLGEKLVRHVQADARVGKATLEVDCENAAAVALYTKLGFTVAGKRKGYYQKARDAFLMTWVRVSAS